MTAMRDKGSCYSLPPYLNQNQKDQKFKKKEKKRLMFGMAIPVSNPRGLQHSGRGVLSLRGQPGLFSKKCPKESCRVGRKGGMKEGGGKDEGFVNT